MFDSFFRADTARTSSVPGSGLGLAICRSIVESHHGKIWLTSEEGEGTRAFLYLPPAQRGRGASMNILIIEDDQSVAELERDYLEINGGFQLRPPHRRHPGAPGRPHRGLCPGDRGRDAPGAQRL